MRFSISGCLQAHFSQEVSLSEGANGSSPLRVIEFSLHAFSFHRCYTTQNPDATWMRWPAHALKLYIYLRCGCADHPGDLYRQTQAHISLGANRWPLSRKMSQQRRVRECDHCEPRACVCVCVMLFIQPHAACSWINFVFCSARWNQIFHLSLLAGGMCIIN